MLARNALLARKLIFTVGAGFALALALIIALTVLGVQQLADTNARLEAIVNENSVKSRLANQMRDILRDRAISMLSIVVMGEPFEKDQEMLRFYEYGATYQTVRQELEPRLKSAEEKAVLARIDRLTRANRPIMVRTVDLGVEGYTFLAFDLLQKEGIPLQRELVKELDELIRIQRAMNANAARDARANYERTRLLLILLGLLAALVAATVAWAVIQRSARLAAITESERTKFQTLFETNTDGIVILDEKGFTDCNPATLEMFRIHRVEEFLARRPEDLGVTPQPDGTPSHVLALSQIREAVKKGHSVFDWIAKRPDGSTFPAEIALHAMTLDSRTVIQAIMRDVSAQKEAEEALKSARDAALSATRMKSQFVANVSHEIRTPMNGVLGMTRLLINSPLNPRQREYAEAISRSAEALMGIINDLLDFSKIEAGRLTLEDIEFDLDALLKDVLALYRPRADAKGLGLRLEEQGPLPHWVRGDPLRLRQILLNLLDNAIKFTEKGEVLLRAQARGGESIRLAVADTGIGIPAIVREHIFQAFAQADGTVSRKFGGTGLGLAICRQLADLMGGELQLDSKPGQGSEFSLELALPVAQKPSRRQEDADIPHAHFPGARVLVAEDNQVNQKLVSYMLEELGIQVLLADNGKVAYDLLEREAVDLVLMDCQMPEWDGLTASREIRTRERRHNLQRVPILALTANSMPGFEATCIEAGMDATLAKPLREEDLNFSLQQWLPARARPGEAPKAAEIDSDELDVAVTVDLAKIRRLCRDDAEKVAEMLDLYVSSSETLLTQLAQAVDQADFPHAARHAHQIKGASAYIGAEAVTRLSAAVETAAKAEDQAACRDALEDLEAAFIRCRLEIEGQRDATGASNAASD